MEDFVIATGVTSSLEDFVEEVFRVVGLDWRNYVIRDPELVRPSEIQSGRADVSRAGSQLGWKARYTMPDVARMMVEAQLARSAMPIRRIHDGQSITTLFSL